MQSALLSLAVLACPVGMGLMMVMMMRGGRSGKSGAPSSNEQELSALRSEVERLKADRAPMDGR